MKYSEKLKSPKWQKKRLEILQRDNFTCICCGDTETELHVNHLKYSGEPWEAKNENLETVCKVCHKLKHTFNFDIKNVAKTYQVNKEMCSLVFNSDKLTYLCFYKNGEITESSMFVFNSISVKNLVKFNKKNGKKIY